MTPEELINSILHLAIQGKLAEQRPEEGTAGQLYQQIRAEKQRLIKAGAIKNESALPEVTEDEKQFDIPENWEWVRVGNITSSNPKNDINDNLEVAFIPMPCVMDGFRNQHTYEIKYWKDIKKGFTHFENGDIGVAKITPCFQNRKSVIFKELKNGYGAGTTELSIVRVLDDTLTREYLLWFFKTNYFIFNGIKSFSGTAGQQRIHKDYLRTCPFPLPPLAEQKRIVTKIEELLPYIDCYAQAWSKLEDFNKRFPTDMQKSILQMAIQGKLVEQRLEEGTGEDLYKHIQAEKKRLIKAGIIKKEKLLPEIAEDEKLFDIPDNWKWVRLPDIASLCLGKMLDRQKNTGTLKPYLRNTNVRWGSFNLDDLLEMKFDNVGSERFLIRENDLVMCEGGEPGRCAVWKNESPIHFQKALHRIRFWGKVNPLFYQYLFQYFASSGFLNSLFTGTTIKHFTGQTLEKIVVPLPPFAEHKRIIARLEEILPLCERLK